jgi:hypothetical protein
LKEHAARWPGQNLVLITNSMGGLVARAVVEDPNLDPGNVRQLVMIAPPNDGSQLARVAHGLDVCEFLLTDDEQQHISWCRASIIDGLAEANRDLRPQSEFLRTLNARPRNPNVRYSILLGTGATMSPQRMSELRAMLKHVAERSRLARLFYPMVDGFLEDLDEVVTGKGDGAVAVKRGVLHGVDDIVMLPFAHSAALGTTSQSVDRELLNAVLSRLHADQH